MAERYAIATGDWSDVTKWDGGVAKPVATDDVYANGYTITVDEDTADTLASLNTIAGGTAAAGGGFSVTGTRTIYATLIRAGSTPCITYSGASGTTLTIDAAGGSITGSQTTSGGNGVNVTGGGALTVTGDVKGGNSSGRQGINVTTTAGAIITVVGDLTGSTQISAYGIYLYSGSGHTVDVTGDCYTSAGPCIYNNTLTATITVTGDVTGTAGSQGALISPSAATGTIDIIGNVLAVAAYGISSAGEHVTVTGNVTGGTSNFSGIVCGTTVANVVYDITGTVTGGSSASMYAHGIYVKGSNGSWATGNTSSLTITGDVYAGTGGCGVFYMTTGGVVFLDGDMINSPQYVPHGGSHSFMAICAVQLVIGKAGGTTWDMYETDKTTLKKMYTADISPGMPADTDVRLSTTYGQSSELTGACAVPGAGSVSLGVPIDAEVGTLRAPAVKHYAVS